MYIPSPAHTSLESQGRGVVWLLLYRCHVYCLTQNMGIQMVGVDIKEIHSICEMTPKNNKFVARECLVRTGKRAILFTNVGNLPRSWPDCMSQTQT